MKIRGGSGQGGGFPGRGGGGRADDFRRGHTVGQTVRGRLLRYEAPRRCWVEIDGRDLLAEIGRDASPGEYLVFRIESLTPDIVLRELSDAELRSQEGGLNLMV
jgi:hypothetical protein